MALSAHDAFGTTGRRRRRGGSRRSALTEINVTPLVDVMLVLLIVFMISAPLLTAGVPLDLPRADAASLTEQSEPVTVSIQRDGTVFVGEQAATLDTIAERVRAAVGPMDANGATRRSIYVRADGRAQYAVVAQVMARLTTAGFSRVGLLTDASGGAPPTGR